MKLRNHATFGLTMLLLILSFIGSAATAQTNTNCEHWITVVWINMPPPDGNSAKEVLTQFCTKDAAGAQLTEEGWHQMSEWFAQPRAPFPGKFIVIRDFGVGQPEIKGDEAAFNVEYIELGQLDSSGRFSKLPGLPSLQPIKIESEYILVRSDAGSHAEDRAAGQPIPTGRWKIKRAQEFPHITVETAIRYVTDLRKRATDEQTRKNAKAALVSLRHQR